LLDTRVLKHHRDAAARAVSDLLDLEVDPATAEQIAARILTAGDSSRPRYVVAMLLANSGRLVILGPFANALAASRAIDRGLPQAGKAGTFALVPWPRLEAVPRRPGEAMSA
jgi:hypothetical protein